MILSRRVLTLFGPGIFYSLKAGGGTPVTSGKHVFFSVGDSSRQAPTTHLRHTFFGLTQASRALSASFWYQRVLERTELPSWKVAWSYIENFLSYSHSKLIKFSVDFFGIFQGSSNFSTYRNEVFQDIFSYSGNRWWIWWIWRLKIRWIAISRLM